MVSKFKRNHDAYVLVVRHLDDADAITVDVGGGSVHTVYLDLGSMFLGEPADEEQALEWVANLRDWLDAVPINSPVYTSAMKTVADTVRNHPQALAAVSAYRARRES
jgi:hypothetical protein